MSDAEMRAMMADGLLATVRDAAKTLYAKNQTYPCDDVKRMATEVTALRAENARLRAALEELLDDVDGQPVTLRIREQARTALGKNDG